MDVWRVALGLALQKSLWYGCGHGAVRILRRQTCSGRGHGSSRARCCGAAALVHNLRDEDTITIMRHVAAGLIGKRLMYRQLIADNGLDSGARA